MIPILRGFGCLAGTSLQDAKVTENDCCYWHGEDLDFPAESLRQYFWLFRLLLVRHSVNI